MESLDRSRTVHRMVRSMLLDRDAADDVAQEVLISVMGSIGSYRGTGKVTSWLHTIVKRRVADHLRAHRESRRLRGSRVLLHRTFTSAREGFLPHDDSSHPHHRPGRWRRSRRRRGCAGHTLGGEIISISEDGVEAV